MLGGASIFLGFSIPMSGLTLIGIGLIIGGVVTMGFGSQMSKRTPNGAYVDAMLKAYRRTLEKTLAQAESMAEVAAEPTVRVLADTPDKAVVWGGTRIARGGGQGSGPRDGRSEAEAAARSSGAYYPLWLGSSGDGGGGSGSLFSGSGVPDVGGMLGTLGSIGSSPASSSSGGGGFGGGGGGGGGGSSGGF